jgi:hypothetical protein
LENGLPQTKGATRPRERRGEPLLRYLIVVSWLHSGVTLQHRRRTLCVTFLPW